VLVHGRGQFGVALIAFRACHSHLDTDRRKARPHPVVDTEKATQIQVAFDPHGNRVQCDAELRGPDPVRDRLAGPERRQRVLHRVCGGAAPPIERGSSALKLCAPVLISTSVTPTSVPCAVNTTCAFSGCRRWPGGCW